jgi:two-component system, cell cycle response regulator DivK
MPETKNKTILIVEDEPQNRKLFRDILEFNGYAVIEASDGRQGVMLAKEHVPDLILMDMQLPVMDGMEATRILQQDEQTKGINIVALTANVMPGDKDKIMEAGCYDFIAKPFRLHEFLHKIAGYFGRSHPKSPTK